VLLFLSSIFINHHLLPFPKTKDCIILYSAAKSMENPVLQSTPQRTSNEPLLASFSCNISTATKGGFRALPFIIVTDGLEKVVSYGLMSTMILYLTREYGMSNADGATVMFILTAAINFIPVVAAFLADSYVGRFWMIAFGSSASILGTFLLWLTAAIPEARPHPCVHNSTVQTCSSHASATWQQLLLLYASLGLISIGSGSMRSSCMAFGADQMMVKSDDIHNSRLLEKIFTWYYVSTSISILLAITVIVYIQDVAGWKVQFGVCVVLMILSSVSFFLASPFYVKPIAKASLVTELAQVLVAACKRRNIRLPSQSSTQLYHQSNAAAAMLHLEQPSENLRFLNKACIIRNPEEELTQEGRAKSPWSLCTVDQVEDLKAVIRVIPIWSTGMIMAVTTCQQSFQLLQLITMDRHITPGFEIPAGSFSIFLIITLLIWVPFYDRVIIPLASKLKGRPIHLGLKQGLGLGILLSSVSMAALGLVENIRRRKAIEQGVSDNPNALVNMSAMWFLMYYVPFGVAEAFNYIGQNEFYYRELPKSMSSISTTLYQMGLSVSNLVASLILAIVDSVTKRGGNESWVAKNINKGHYDYYYWVLGCLCVGNFGYYVCCSKAYGPCKGEVKKALDQGEDI
ncbi:Protein NRT1/ PTR FAMILY 1.2, partial [Linum perenne]